MNFGTLLCCCGTHEKTHGLSQKIQAMYFKIQEGVSKCTPSFFMHKAPTFTSWGFVIT